MPLSVLSSHEVLSLIADRSRDEEFGYVVTPNVDHVVRAHRLGPRVTALYRQAWISICDSRVLQRLGDVVGQHFPVTTGSDLTRELFRRVMVPGDRITVIGCSERTVAVLAERFPQISIFHYNPPMGFINDEAEVERVVSFVAEHPARFIFLCVGSPRQELVAQRLRQRRGITGLGLCVGNALSFLAFPATRSPGWMSRCGLEWLHRLATNPSRLWRRYLLEDPLVFAIFAKAAVLHRAVEPAPVMSSDLTPLPQENRG
jgi:exopolysaccharide biosynthesis WecB/TagA/CpsF family protein